MQSDTVDLMRIVTVRRISQAFFLFLFFWFCIVSTFGERFWQLRGWPVDWFLQIDPLVAVGTMLTTGTLYAGLSWALLTVILTVIFGRFFCSWVCPFGTMHHMMGYLGKRGKTVSGKAEANEYHRGQSIKYYLLVFLLSAATGALMARAIRTAFEVPVVFWFSIAATIALAVLAVFGFTGRMRQKVSVLVAVIGVWTLVGLFYSMDRMIGASLQTGLLDPIPLVYRSVNLVLLPLVDSTHQVLSVTQRHYEGAWLIGAVFFAALLLNFRTPRFYCRYICPLGALYGVLSRFSLWRIGKKRNECVQCRLCEANCEGACQPTNTIRLSECVLCMNCLDDCRHDLIGYQTISSASGEIVSPDMSRRGFVVALASGVLVVPMIRLGGYTEQNWNPAVIRPPGALSETDFLSRCIKCGQCMRICPTNIIQPAGLETGLEGLWTPVLNYRIGTSGCQLNCIACSHVCPTAAIRPISLDEKLGRGEFADLGPVRLGCAFVDRGRCLPWAMDKPCIVCQETCPVSPKAIFVREYFSTLRNGVVEVVRSDARTLEISGSSFLPGQLSTGDYFVRLSTEPEGKRRQIVDNADRTLAVDPRTSFPTELPLGTKVEIQVRLQRPQVDPKLCIGCGVCEHECPVSGKRAIQVWAENESRSKRRSMLL